MKALTVQQPWAWCVVCGYKPVDNRTQVWKHRGPLAIHAGMRWSDRGAASPLVRNAVWDFYGTASPLDEPRFSSRESPRVFGAIIGVVNVVDVHWEHPHCCDGNPWAEHQERPMLPLEQRKPISHLVLEEALQLPEPVPCRGALGLWTVPDELEIQVALQIAAAMNRSEESRTARGGK